MEGPWFPLSVFQNSLFFLQNVTLAYIPHIPIYPTIPLRHCHLECLTYHFSLITCLSAPPQIICMCSYRHTCTHTLFLYALRHKITYKQLSCAPSSLISVGSVSTWFEWSGAGSKENLWDRFSVRDALQEFSYQALPQQAIRSYIYCLWQAKRERRYRQRWDVQKSAIYFFCRVIL